MWKQRLEAMLTANVNRTHATVGTARFALANCQNDEGFMSYVMSQAF